MNFGNLHLTLLDFSGLGILQPQEAAGHLPEGSGRVVAATGRIPGVPSSAQLQRHVSQWVGDQRVRCSEVSNDRWDRALCQFIALSVARQTVWRWFDMGCAEKPCTATSMSFPSTTVTFSTSARTA